ncbi:hypothetical protein CAAN1_01S07360 [[Candida] anglica]|uniref:NAD(P)-binding domain-containing protein n=1 Tax=[Candida] anglica TaxID=148631 RepID=A0ABP0ENZ4_9ASCO
MNVTIIGGTGLVGSYLVKAAEAATAISTINTISRRQIEGTKINSIVKATTAEWTPEIEKLSATNKVFFSAFGTTRADAGGIDNFKKIDIDTNFAAAKAAKNGTIDTYVLVSTVGANKGSIVPYLKLKGGLEDDVISLGFKRTIILRPGVLIGDRVKPKGLLNDLAVKVGVWTRDSWLFPLVKATHADEVAKVALHLALQPLKEGTESEVRIVEAQEIVELAAKL